MTMIICGGDFIKKYLIVNINNINTELFFIRKSKKQYYIEKQLTYEKGSLDLNKEDNNTYVDEVVKIIKENLNQKLKNIYFNIQNDEIIIRNIKDIKSKRQNEIIQLIKYEIFNHMPLDLQNYVIKYKKIINTNGNRSIQGILFPKKYVDICKLIGENLKIHKQYLYVNFDILQKLIDLGVINLYQNEQETTTIIENRQKDMILNIIFNKKIIESYVIDKVNSTYPIGQSLFNDNTYYYGISDDFITNLEIKRLNIENKLILNDKGKRIDMTLNYLPVWGMIM